MRDQENDQLRRDAPDSLDPSRSEQSTRPVKWEPPPEIRPHPLQWVGFPIGAGIGLVAIDSIYFSFEQCPIFSLPGLTFFFLVLEVLPAITVMVGLVFYASMHTIGLRSRAAAVALGAIVGVVIGVLAISMFGAQECLDGGFPWWRTVQATVVVGSIGCILGVVYRRTRP